MCLSASEQSVYVPGPWPGKFKPGAPPVKSQRRWRIRQTLRISHTQMPKDRYTAEEDGDDGEECRFLDKYLPTCVTTLNIVLFNF